MSYKCKIKEYIKTRPKLKNFIKSLRGNLYSVFNLSFPFLKLSAISKFRNLDLSCQPFILTRHDLGCWLHTLHYASVWKNLRGDVAVFVLSSYWKEIFRITEILFPDLKIVNFGNRYLSFLRKLFGNFCLQTQTLNPIYGIVRSHRLDSIVLFDMPMELEWPFRAPYNPQVDPLLMKPSELSIDFIESYKKFRCYSQHRHEFLHDYGDLVYRDKLRGISPEIKRRLLLLKRNLRFEEPYAVLNVNCKEYYDSILNRRSIHFPERYEVVIDELINRGYYVILQGREEQPRYKQRNKLIDYARSEYISLENDVALYSGCSLIISSKTGPEVFGTIFDTPTIGFNYVEPSGLTPTKKLRYHPKLIREKNTGRILSWKEYYFHPCFFNFGQIYFDEFDHEYLDLSEETLYKGLQEVLPLIGKSQEEWDRYSDLQRAFKAALTPLHLGANACPGVPLDCYLKS